MNSIIDPLLVFGLSSALAANLALLLWRPHRKLAIRAAVLSGFSLLCVALEIAARSVRANIRIDLLVTIPAISLVSILVGVMAVRRPPMAAQFAAAGLTIVGGVTFGWFSWISATTNREGQRLTRVFDQARKLYWEETIRCDVNFARRFGPTDRNGACHGNLAVTSGTGSYPFTRLIVNDNEQVYLLFSPEPGIEESVVLDDRTALSLKPAAQAVMSGESDTNGQRIHVELLPLATGACKAKVDRDGHTSVLTMTKVDLPHCKVLADPPIYFVGAWGSLETVPSAPHYRRIVQIWLWETDGMARGL